MAPGKVGWGWAAKTEPDSAPEGRKPIARGESPWASFATVPQAPEGRNKLLSPLRGLEIAMVPVPQGLAPLAIGFRPYGTKKMEEKKKRDRKMKGGK